MDIQGKHPYPCVHSTPQNGLRYMYSSINNKGIFATPKVIFGDSGENNMVVDIDGQYGMTQHAMCIASRDIQESKISLTVGGMVDMCS